MSSWVTLKFTPASELSVKLKVTTGAEPENALLDPAKPAARKIPELSAVVSKITTSPAAELPMRLTEDASTVAIDGSQRISKVKVVYPEVTAGLSAGASVQTVLMVCEEDPEEVSVGLTFNMVLLGDDRVSVLLKARWRHWCSRPPTSCP